MKVKNILGEEIEIERARGPLVPTAVFLTSGIGVADHPLTSRENAMTAAGVEKVNMLKASSIIPPRCPIISKEQGRERLVIGQMTFAIMAEATTNEPHQLIAAAIGVAKPEDEEEYGFFTEIEQGFGKTAEKAGEEVRRLAIQNLAMSWRDNSFNLEEEWRLDKKLYRVKNKNVHLSDVTETTRGDKDGLHTTVFVAAVFLF